MACSRIIALAFVLCGCAQIAGLDDSGDGHASTPGTVQGAGNPTPRATPCPNVAADQPSIDFGETKVGGKVREASVRLRNDGDADTVLAPAIAGDGFSLVVPGDIALKAHQEMTVQLRYAPTTLGGSAGSVVFASKGQVCDFAPTIKLAGVGSNSSILVSPSVLDFGDVDCGAIPPARAVSLTSDLDSPMPFTFSTATSFFKLDRSSQLVDARTMLSVSVTASAAPKDSLAPVESQLIAQSAAIKKTVGIRLQPKGVVLAFEPKSLEVNAGSTKTITARNLGNKAGTIVVEPTSYKFTIPNGRFDLAPNEAKTFQVTFFDDKSSTTSPTVRVEGAALCKRDALDIQGNANKGGGPGPW